VIEIDIFWFTRQSPSMLTIWPFVYELVPASRENAPAKESKNANAKIIEINFILAPPNNPLIHN
jgi:hypothetical protein